MDIWVNYYSKIILIFIMIIFFKADNAALQLISSSKLDYWKLY